MVQLDAVLQRAKVHRRCGCVGSIGASSFSAARRFTCTGLAAANMRPVESTITDRSLYSMRIFKQNCKQSLLPRCVSCAITGPIVKYSEYIPIVIDEVLDAQEAGYPDSCDDILCELPESADAVAIYENCIQAGPPKVAVFATMRLAHLFESEPLAAFRCLEAASDHRSRSVRLAAELVYGAIFLDMIEQMEA